jgi:hypothetical protein
MSDPKTVTYPAALTRMRHLELLHAVSCLERASILLVDEFTPDIKRLLENVKDTVELVTKRGITKS